MKFIKYSFILLILLLLLAAAGVAYMVAFFDANSLRQEASEATRNMYGRELNIAGDLQLTFWPAIGVRIEDVSLTEPDGETAFASLAEVHIAVETAALLTQQVKVKQIRLIRPKVVLIKRKDGALNINDLMGGGAAGAAPANGGAGAAPPPLTIAGVNIEDAEVTWRDEGSGESVTISDLDLSTSAMMLDAASHSAAVEAVKAAVSGNMGEDAFVLELNAPRIDFSPTGAEGDAVSLTAAIDGQQRKLNAMMTIDKIAMQAGAVSIGRLSFNAEASEGESVLKASLSSPLSVDMAQQKLSLEKYSGDVFMAHPQLPAGSMRLPLAGAFSIDALKQTLAFSLDSKLDESSLSLRLDALKLSPLSLMFELDIDQIDIDRYLPPPAEQGEETGEMKEGDEEAGRIDLSPLRQLGDMRINGVVRIGKLTVSKVRMESVDLTIEAADGKLKLSPHSLDLYGGGISGALLLDAEGNRVQLREKLSGVELQPLLQDLAGEDMLSGKGDVALDLSTAGDSIDAMKKGLSGSASISLADGAVKGYDFAGQLRRAKSLLSRKTNKSAAPDAGKKTDFTELTATFAISDGVARNDDLALKSPLLRLSGAGDIDIGASTVDYLARASLVASSKGQGGASAKALAGVTLPVRFSGPFAKPEWQVEPGALVGESAKAAVKEKTEQAKQKVEDKLKGKLKGLFGG
ncbi:AsmA family protein [bacterium]|nr:AsmA family protein [bacterium]